MTYGHKIYNVYIQTCMPVCMHMLGTPKEAASRTPGKQNGGLLKDRLLHNVDIFVHSEHCSLAYTSGREGGASGDQSIL